MSITRSRPLASRKILDLPALLALRATARSSGKTLIHCHGCFDIVHPGHIRYFQFAKQQGDLLLVSLTADPHVGKGEGRPYVPQELRAENLAALEFVDAVYINPTPTAVDLLATLKPDVYIKGREYEHNQHPGFLKERSAVEAYGGRVIFSSGDVVYSSSHIIDSYASRLDLEQEKLDLFCKRYNVRRSPLLELLDAIVDRPFTIVGDTILDRYQYCDASDIAADGPNMSLSPLESRDYLGGAAIVARHLAGLGAEPTLLTSLGTDDASDAALDELESAGVHVLPIRNRKKIATRTRFVVDNQKLFTLEECPATPSDSANEKYLLDQARKLASVDGHPASLLLYDAGLGVITDSAARALLRLATGPSSSTANRGAPGYAHAFAGTASSRGKLSRLTDVDLLVASERAIRIATRDHEQGVSALACRILTDHRAGGLLMPLGKKGLMSFDAPDAKTLDPAAPWEGRIRSEYLASPINGTIDRLGSDEALLATASALLAAEPCSPNIPRAAYTALLASILSSRHPGHSPLDGHELRTLLESRPELTD